MGVGIDEAWHRDHARPIDVNAGIAVRRFNFGTRADGNDPVALNCDCGID